MREATKVIIKHFAPRLECGEIRGAEIGVCLGYNAQDFLEKIPSLFLHLVDDLSELKDNITGLNYLPDLGREIRKIPNNRYAWHLISSTDASRDIKDESLDFVYIDANHCYEYALQDCRLWWWKVKVGGILCGHDYSLTFPDGEGRISTHVQEAIDQFAKDMGLTVHHDQNVDDKNNGHSPIHDWWIFKE